AKESLDVAYVYAHAEPPNVPRQASCATGSMPRPVSAHQRLICPVKSRDRSVPRCHDPSSHPSRNTGQGTPEGSKSTHGIIIAY
ncbi:hypothetical protein HAX54_028887, partial [Datura stramonium]|nr:hypothetical protein [Datura stramonium]